MHRPHQWRSFHLEIYVNGAGEYRVGDALRGKGMHTCPASFNQILADGCWFDILIE